MLKLSRPRLVVVDLDRDDEELCLDMTDRFGSTPLIVKSRRGYHMYYRGSAGDRQRDLRKTDGLPVEIKTELIIAPPSVNYQSGWRYDFERGRIEDIRALPPMKQHSVEGERAIDESMGAFDGSAPPIGMRSNTLFKLGMRLARHTDSEETLFAALLHENAQLQFPLSTNEVGSIAKSVWGYQIRGENWIGGEARAVTPRSLFDRLEGNSDALMLLCLLRMEHSAREEPFAFSARAMAQAESIKDWTDYRRYTAAMGWLVEIGECECVHKGGARKGDVSRYQFKNGTASTQALGYKNCTQYNHTGPSLSLSLLTRCGFRVA